MSKHFSLITLILLLGLVACAPDASSTPDAATTPETTLPDPEVATPTVGAAAANVGGEEISRATFDLHLDLYQAAQTQTGTLLATEEAEQQVINNLIDRLLLAQGAREQGFSADSVLEERLANLVQQAGGQEAFDAWLAANGYTSEVFRAELALEIEAAHMRDLIAVQVPTAAEQVHARQILLSDQFSADRLLGQLNEGTSFEQVVANNDPARFGDLGWFPRGYLLQPEVDEAAFALQPGEYSQVVQSELGFHLIEVIERDPARPLNPQALLQLQTQAIADWLDQRRTQTEVSIFLP
jgi:parvulin-like peptidyl-prolyl isomerase